MNEGQKKFYITTPIYYPSDNLHVGHTYCTVMADAMARFKRAQGYDVRFLTGTDEHGQKIQDIAKKSGVSPLEYVDKIVEGIKILWERMEISYDDFIRTTEPRHVERVQKIFMELYQKGDIYLGKYEGHYCTPCEAFWTENQLAEENKCPDCGRPVGMASEDAYFFRLSKYQDALLKLFKEKPEFLQPEARRNEMIAFVEQGLEDLCISRTSFDWGIPVPIGENHIIYVWLDALSNYITALGYPDQKDLYEEYWPADVHLVGKEIVRFHTIIWPAMLMSMEEPLPKQVLGHGWLLMDGGKMSKSKGNVADPVILIDRYGIDALKYFLLREYSFGQDGLFTNEVMLRRMNFDLANDLGNLLSRTVSMIEKYNVGVVPTSTCPGDFDSDLIEIAMTTKSKVEEAMETFKFNVALENIWRLIGRANKYIDETMPWILAKEAEDKPRLDTVLFNLAEVLRVVSVLIYPFMHTTSANMREQLGVGEQPAIWEEADKFNLMAGKVVKKGDPIFPRLDIAKELKALEEMSGQEKNSLDKKSTENIKAQTDGKENSQAGDMKPEIEYEDFDKLDLRVGKILDCKKHPKADKLLVFQVKLGEETRQIISGVAECYQPSEVIGQKVVVVANLAPRKLRGLVSNGMLLFADNIVDGKERFEFVSTIAEDGNSVS